MGFTGLARWTNSTGAGLEMVSENIRNHVGSVYRGKWMLAVRSYRSTLAPVTGQPSNLERLMYAVTMNDNVFVFVEDPMAPVYGDPSNVNEGQMHTASHHRNTCVTISPPGSMELLLGQTRARWVPVRQTVTGPNAAQAGLQQILVEGSIFSIGNDWLVRVGNVVAPGGTVKGMLMEAEYLPLPCVSTLLADNTSELTSNLLSSLLPPDPDAKIVAVAMSDAQWQEILGSGDSDDYENVEEVTDDIYVYGTTEPRKKKGDWSGLDRDRRSAFMIHATLKSEGIM